MGFYSYLAVRSINVFLVIVVTMALTIGLFFNAFHDIKVQAIKDEVRGIISGICRTNPARCQNQTDIQNYANQLTATLMHAQGLDKPWYEQLWPILRDILSFNFGRAQSLQADNGDNTVSVIIAERIPRTVLLLGTAVLLTTIIGLVLGLYSANKPQGILDKTVIVAGLTSNAFAAWWVGLLLQFIFAYQLRLLPPIGIMDYTIPHNNFFDVFVDVLRHLTLPLTSLVIVSVGGWALVVRNLLISTLAEDFISAARSKGVPERRILFGHAMRSAAPPIITIVALSVAGIFGGAIITETVFQWNGLGWLIWQAIGRLDMPVILAFFYISTILIVIANFIADMLYGIFDPRVKTG
ncbi:MAG TPA: ABC transporter permease [Geobacterales bacterium]|nr:ABC transporter permease [Geobacterales bacterium]